MTNNKIEQGSKEWEKMFKELPKKAQDNIIDYLDISEEVDGSSMVKISDFFLSLNDSAEDEGRPVMRSREIAKLERWLEKYAYLLETETLLNETEGGENDMSNNFKENMRMVFGEDYPATRTEETTQENTEKKGLGVFFEMEFGTFDIQNITGEPCRLCGTSQNEFEMCSACYDYTEEMMREVEIEEEEGYFATITTTYKEGDVYGYFAEAEEVKGEEGYFYGKQRTIGVHHSQEEMFFGMDTGSSAVKVVSKVEPCHICETSDNEFELCTNCWNDMEKKAFERDFKNIIREKEDRETKQKIFNWLEETIKDVERIGKGQKTRHQLEF